jgi:hypothetical protein
VFDSQSEFCLWNVRWRRAILIFALFPTLAALSSCGSSSTTTAPTISITASASTVNVNGTVQFTPNISGLSSTLANWEVNGTLGGNSTYGTIDSNGKYIAPATVPPGSANVVTITAIAQAQTSLTATATVTIEPPASITQITPPSPISVAAGLQQAFTATFSSGTGNGVYWYINNSPTCSTTLGYLNGQVPVTGGFAYPYGQMTSQGVYTAPVIPPPGGAIALTAVSQADAKQTLCEVVNLTFGNASLQGAFVFSSMGRVISSNHFFARAGSFTAAGGAIVGGLETYNEVGLTQAAQYTNSWVGSYNIGPDGRGTMEFCENTTIGTCNDSIATAFFRIVILNSQQVRIVEFSPNGSSVAARTGSGELIAQATPLPSPGLLALNGAYTFSLAGESSTAQTVSVIGEFSADGQGHIGTNVISMIPGLMNINDSSRATPVTSAQIDSTSFYSIPSNGKGSVTLQTTDPVYSQLVLTIYVVSSGRAKFIESDGISVLAGDIYEQQTSGVSCTWGPNLLNGPLVIATHGSNPNGEIADLIRIQADGAGNASAVSNDENNAGAVTHSTSLAGNYTVDSTTTNCGTGTLTLGTPPSYTYVFYMISSSDVVIQETTTGVVASGHMVAPVAGSPALNPLTSFALNLAGTNAAGASANREDIVGQINTDGTGKVIANTGLSTPGSLLDINNFGGTQNDPLASGALDLTGAMPASLKDLAGVTRTFVLYPVSATQYYVLGTDTTDVAFGSLYQQF